MKIVIRTKFGFLTTDYRTSIYYNDIGGYNVWGYVGQHDESWVYYDNPRRLNDYNNRSYITKNAL